MKFATKYTLFFIFLLIFSKVVAQKPATPKSLSASRNYHDYIRVEWKATQANHTYQLYRNEQGKKVKIITLGHDIGYVDRDSSLQFFKDYTYHVRAVAPNGVLSDESNVAIGMKIGVAAPPKPIPDSGCIDITLTQCKASAQGFALTFLARSKCKKDVQLTLFRSDDAQLDSPDNFLTQLSFGDKLTRGALTAKNNGEPIQGYLIVKVELEGAFFTKSCKIE